MKIENKLNTISEPFFIAENYYESVGDWLDDISIGEIEEWGDDSFETLENAELEPILTVDMNFLVDAIWGQMENFEDRFMWDDDEGNERLEKEIKKAIEQSIDIEKLNELLPRLYYPNQQFTKVSNVDILDYLRTIDS